MKRAKILGLILTAAATFVSGCKHPAKSLTVIPGREATPLDSAQTGGPKGTGDKGPLIGLDQPTRERPLGADDPSKLGVGSRPDGAQNREALALQTVHFDYDKSSIRANERPKLETVAAYLKDHPKDTLIIEGNCDERGTPEYNRSLGERRAIAARDYLVQSQHVDSARITTVSFGEDKPADDGHNEAAWSKNRRDEFVIVTAQQ
jgi:peptidoglycan-associated lipoprotein